MSVDSRSIDFANTASIDMMALNNKVVNMRQVVKRTKVQVINKLCKNIAALKKKKGTEEQKTQNLRKAQRLIEEIDSIKRLKEDKVSKYSLANTTSFTDVCKTSLSAGPRAMARLADHSLMKKVVGDFRAQHSDWRDLAAYLLIKQTGRRFKTKKQKQGKKLSRSVENIQASETMTKAYIQERFGEEGLKKAEQRFERKRKRSLVKGESQAENEEEEPQSKQNSENRKETVADSEDKVKAEDERDIDVKEQFGNDTAETTKEAAKSKRIKKDDDTSTTTAKSKTSTSEIEPEPIKPYVPEIVPSPSKKKEIAEQKPRKSDISKAIETESEKLLVENQPATDSESDSSDGNSSDLQDISKLDSLDNTSKKKNECVVKEIDINEAGGYSFEKEATSDDEDSQTSSDSNSDHEDLSQSKSAMSKRQQKKAELRKKKVPDMLTNKPERASVSDPFFVGTDDDEEEEDGAPNDFDEALRYEPGDEEFADTEHRGNRSMFYNPHGEEVYRKGVRIPARGGSNSRGGGRWQRQERGRDWDRRGRGSGPQRGRGTFQRGATTSSVPGRGYPRSNQSFGGSRFDRSAEMRQDRPNSTSSNTVPAPSSSEKLHPSWEASKKRKAEQSGIQAFKGSKITFDDDD